jgi:hypothetical protein
MKNRSAPLLQLCSHPFLFFLQQQRLVFRPDQISVLILDSRALSLSLSLSLAGSQKLQWVGGSRAAQHFLHLNGARFHRPGRNRRLGKTGRCEHGHWTHDQARTTRVRVACQAHVKRHPARYSHVSSKSLSNLLTYFPPRQTLDLLDFCCS